MTSAKTAKGAASTKEIGNRFRLARKHMKLTQAELVESIGISTTALSRFEKGRRGIQSDRLLALLRVAAERGMNVDGYVLRGQGEPVRAGSEHEMLQRILHAVEGQKSPGDEAFPVGKRATR